MKDSPTSAPDLDALWPTAWREGQRGSTAMFVSSIAVLVFALAGSTYATGNVFLRFPLLYGVPFLVAFAGHTYGMVIGSRHRPHTQRSVSRAGRDGSLVMLRWSVTAKVWFGLITGSAPFACLGLHYFFDIMTEKNSEDSTPQILSALCLILGAIALFPALAMIPLTVKRWRLGVAFSSSGIWKFTWTGAYFFPWEKLRGVDVSVNRFLYSGRTQFSPMLQILSDGAWPRRDGESWLAPLPRVRKSVSGRPSPGQLVANPVVMYMTIGFYLRNPERRGELGTDEGLRRIRELDFPEEIADLKRYGEIRGVTAS